MEAARYERPASIGRARMAWRRLVCRAAGHGAYVVPAWLLPQFVLTPVYRVCVRCGRVWE